MNQAHGRLISLIVCLLVMAHAVAHPISVTRTSAYVTPERVMAEIEVFVEDLYLFHKLQPNEQDFLEPDVVRTGIDMHQDFLLERFVIRDVDGQRLDGCVVDVKQFDMDERGVPLAELMAHTIVFKLQYDLPAPPEFLTISQHFSGSQGTIPAEMKLLIKQAGAGTTYVTVLNSDQPNTIRLSWDNPPLSPEALLEEQEQWLERQKQETLGITSYSSVYSFLYINDREVRHEILIPLLTLAASVPIGGDEDEFLNIAEQDAAREQIEAYFATGNPVDIDGVPVEPSVERCDFYSLDFKDFANRTERRRVSMSSARVGIILSYRTAGNPGTVKLTWDRFNKHVWAINMHVYAYDKMSKVTLSRLGNNNVFDWRQPKESAPLLRTPINLSLPSRPQLCVPLLSLFCLLLIPPVALTMKLSGFTGRPCLLAIALLAICAMATWPLLRREVPNPLAMPQRVSDVEAKTVLTSLLKNMYRTFECRVEEDVYDALAESVDGELITDIYLQIRRALEMQEQGGAISRVQEVNLVEGHREPFRTSETRDLRGFRYLCRWNVNGTVEHWGHIHARTNQYEAVFTVEPRHKTWKIVGFELLDETRLHFETILRGL